MATIHEHMLAQKQVEWRRAGVSLADVTLAIQTGMDGRDVGALRAATRELHLVIVVRCPKPEAVVWHGILPAKTWATKKKTGTSGAVARDQDFETWTDEKKRENPQPGHAMVSDYDLMSVWRRAGMGWEKVFVSSLPPGASRGPFPREASRLIRQLNATLLSKIQHGCQDDWHNRMNPGVKPSDHFAAFGEGKTDFLPSPRACARYYSELGLDWPYGQHGRHAAASP